MKKFGYDEREVKPKVCPIKYGKDELKGGARFKL